ncbi:hypothetical protein [Rhizobium vallis]|uniref:hypothetical protein n=1 Tax=Rhizobium vallis TaxID=634290 RepID=UPI000F890C09|nr:hypothetical protein [Rhizobium vallis]
MIRIFVSLSVIALALCMTAADGRADPYYGPPDNSCEVVNRAYEATHNQYHYREIVYSLDADGSKKEVVEMRYSTLNVFQRYSGKDWEVYGIPKSDPDQLKFTSCTFVEGGKTLRYYANWHKGKYLASAEILLSPQPRKLLWVIRRYPPDGQQFAFPTAISVFDYDAESARPPRLENGQ